MQGRALQRALCITAQDRAGASAPPANPLPPDRSRVPRLPRGFSRTPGSAGAGIRATGPT